MDIFGAGNASNILKDQPKNSRKAMHHRSRVNPQMMQQRVLTIRGLPKEIRPESRDGKPHIYNHQDLVGSLQPHQINSDSSRPVAKHYCLPLTLQLQQQSFGNNPDQEAVNPLVHTAISRPASLVQCGNGDDKQSPPHPPLTIFYNGTVKVYDISAQKAKAIMTLAGIILGSPHQNPTVKPLTAASSSPISSISKSTVRHMTSLDLAIARKQSLQRFLEKRKDRLNKATPYGSEFNSKQPEKDGLSGEGNISSA